jgi:hypothetical protein
LKSGNTIVKIILNVTKASYIACLTIGEMKIIIKRNKQNKSLAVDRDINNIVVPHV